MSNSYLDPYPQRRIPQVEKTEPRALPTPLPPLCATLSGDVSLGSPAKALPHDGAGVPGHLLGVAEPGVGQPWPTGRPVAVRECVLILRAPNRTRARSGSNQGKAKPLSGGNITWSCVKCPEPKDKTNQPENEAESNQGEK